MPDHPEAKPETGFAMIDPLANAVAVFTAMSLGMAFLFDMTFFFALEPRVLGLLVLTDHIETAVTFVPVMLVLGLLLLTYPFVGRYLSGNRIHNALERIAKTRRSRMAVRLFALLVGIILLVAFVLVIVSLLSAVHWALWAFTTLAIPVLAAGWTMVSFVERTSTSTNNVGASPHFSWDGRTDQKRLFIYASVFMTLTVLLVGFSLGLTNRTAVDQEQGNDVIWMNDMSSVRGLILRTIDRGVIVGTGKAVVFFPKDQVRRIELRPIRLMEVVRNRAYTRTTRDYVDKSLL